MGWQHLTYQGSIQLCLIEGETILAQQTRIGLYQAKVKDPVRVDGTVYVTSLRLIYLDRLSVQRESLAVWLSTISSTSHYAGFLNSSPKITITFNTDYPAPDPTSLSPPTNLPPPSPSPSPAPSPSPSTSPFAWVCRVCGMSNPPINTKCSLCGITDSTKSSQSPLRTTDHNSAAVVSRSKADSPLDGRARATGAPAELSCPVCTYLNHPDLSSCEVCGSRLQDRSPSTSSSSIPSRSSSPLPGGAKYAKLSFRQSGDKAFYNALKTAIANKAWNQAESRPAQPSSGGIDGLIREIDSTAQGREDDIQAALKDLNSLMRNAKEMITIARALSSESETGQRVVDEDITESLASLGSVDSDESARHAGDLARELATLLSTKPGILLNGVVGLDQVWCAWNRARGMALISPREFKLACVELASVSSARFSFKVFPSGLAVLHTSKFSTGAVSSRLLDLVDLRQAIAASSATEVLTGATTLELAKAEELSLNITLHLIHEAENSGLFARDEQADYGLRWHRNLFGRAEWDGQPLG